jgi:uroporphyrin-III C-methyltransferase/precorrin-2 dehydrogenase/sirohydrochlorin ferrochelatase
VPRPRPLFPIFLKLAGRDVLIVGGGSVAAAKCRSLRPTGARIRVVAPAVLPELAREADAVERRGVRASDVDGAWLVVAAATPDVNRRVARAAERRRVFVNAVDDPDNASAYLGGVIHRDGVTVAISTNGRAPALAGLLREGIEAILPADLASWLTRATRLRRQWRARGVPMAERRPALLEALARLHHRRASAPIEVTQP